MCHLKEIVLIEYGHIVLIEYGLTEAFVQLTNQGLNPHNIKIFGRSCDFIYKSSLHLLNSIGCVLDTALAGILPSRLDQRPYTN